MLDTICSWSVSFLSFPFGPDWVGCYWVFFLYLLVGVGWWDCGVFFVTLFCIFVVPVLYTIVLYFFLFFSMFEYFLAFVSAPKNKIKFTRSDAACHWYAELWKFICSVRGVATYRVSGLAGVYRYMYSQGITRWSRVWCRIE